VHISKLSGFCVVHFVTFVALEYYLGDQIKNERGGVLEESWIGAVLGETFTERGNLEDLGIDSIILSK